MKRRMKRKFRKYARYGTFLETWHIDGNPIRIKVRRTRKGYLAPKNRGVSIYQRAKVTYYKKIHAKYGIIPGKFSFQNLGKRKFEPVNAYNPKTDKHFKYEVAKRQIDRQTFLHEYSQKFSESEKPAMKVFAGQKAYSNSQELGMRWYIEGTAVYDKGQHGIGSGWHKGSADPKNIQRAVMMLERQAQDGRYADLGKYRRLDWEIIYYRGEQ